MYSDKSAGVPVIYGSPRHLLLGILMPVIFKCECGQYLSVGNKHINGKFRCPVCAVLSTVPSPSELESKSLTSNNSSATNGEESCPLDDSGRCRKCGARMASAAFNNCPMRS